MNIKRTYMQGIINTDKHPVFNKGQIVDIISETRDGLYLIQCNVTGKPDFIRKEYIKFQNL